MSTLMVVVICLVTALVGTTGIGVIANVVNNGNDSSVVLPTRVPRKPTTNISDHPAPLPPEDHSGLTMVMYPVNGSTELVKYIATAIMGGTYSIDLSMFFEDNDSSWSVTAIDAAWEAILQNPFTLIEPGTNFHTSFSNQTLRISYAFDDGNFAQELAAQREELWEKSESIVSSIITDSMSDRDKALAINQWLIDNATYDRAAFNASNAATTTADLAPYRESWSPVGVMINGTGVCESYAYAFKLLSDLAGVPAVHVTGDVWLRDGTGGRHAWNEVYLDGKWTVVDPTWNDSYYERGQSSTTYFEITDAQANREKDKYWMVDSNIDSYVAY